MRCIVLILVLTHREWLRGGDHGPVVCENSTEMIFDK
jgi:hypothetical protein